MIVKHRGQQKDKSVRLREIRKKRRARLLVAACFVAVGCVGGLAWYTHAASQRIEGVVVHGAKLVDEEVVREAAERVLDGSTLLIFSNRYPWLAPLSRAKNAVEKIPSVASAIVRVADGDMIEVTVTERIPVAIGCGTTCSLIDDRGIAIGEIDRATTTLPRIELADGIARSFDVVVPTEFLEPSVLFLSQMNAAGFGYSSVRVVDEQQLEAHGMNHPMIKAAFDTIAGAPMRITTAISAGALRADLSGISYVDARFERSISYLPSEYDVGLLDVSTTQEESEQE